MYSTFTTHGGKKKKQKNIHSILAREIKRKKEAISSDITTNPREITKKKAPAFRADKCKLTRVRDRRLFVLVQNTTSNIKISFCHGSFRL